MNKAGMNTVTALIRAYISRTNNSEAELMHFVQIGHSTSIGNERDIIQ